MASSAAFRFTFLGAGGSLLRGAKSSRAGGSIDERFVTGHGACALRFLEWLEKNLCGEGRPVLVSQKSGEAAEGRQVREHRLRVCSYCRYAYL